jgi:cell division cycle 20-like protein 1 (cofactor of APC complex)
MSRDPDGLRSAGASSSAPPPVFTSPTPLSPYNEKSDSRHPKSNGVTYSDRFIPSRQRGVPLHDSFALLPDSPGAAPKKRDSPQTVGSSDAASKDDNLDTYSMLLRSELLGPDQLPSPSYRSFGADQQPSPQQRNLFRFRASPTARDENAAFSLSPVGQDSQRVLASPRKAPRKISTVPYKVLDAPALQDDFYLNLVDWSSLNVLAVGLGSCVYLWSACTSKVTKLCDLGPDDSVTSVAWTQRGTHLAVGTSVGEVQIWDAAKCAATRTMGGHQARVGTLCWSGHTLSSGSRDRLIYQRDARVAEHFTSKLAGHKQEVCGLKWSFDGQQLASGGNDNKLYIWSAHMSQPVQRFSEHTAAVKAIAWSPHQNGLLASGGGTADRCIRFWSTQTASALSCVDTGSQVCNLCWSKNINELVSTHGYSQNQIVVWRYSSMQKVATLTGHTLRVLYLAMSPDGQTIVTGAGDETLRFWNVFPGPKTKGDASDTSSMLDFQGRTAIR